jgi:hypothetical protein
MKIGCNQAPEFNVNDRKQQIVCAIRIQDSIVTQELPARMLKLVLGVV